MTFSLYHEACVSSKNKNRCKKLAVVFILYSLKVDLKEFYKFTFIVHDHKLCVY